MSQPTTVQALAGLSGPEAATAWATLVERHGPDIWRVIVSRSRDTHDAEDSYQDFWIGLPRAALGFRPVGGERERGARAWLMRVAYTTAIDHGRRRKSIQASAITAPVHRNADMDAHDDRTTGSGPLGQAEAPPMPRNDSEEISERSRLMERVQTAIATLPETYRRPLLLHLVGELSYDDLAADLRCTVNHARVKVHRGLKRLREMLGVDEKRLSDQSLAGMVVPLLAMPAAPPLPPPVLAAAAATSHGAAVAIKVASLVGMGSLVVGAMAAAVLAVKVDPPPTARAPVTPAAESEIVLDRFERAAAGLEAHGDHDKNAELSLVDAPAGTGVGAGSGKALRVAWPADHRGWIDCTYYVPRRALPQLTAQVSGSVTMNVWSDGGDEVQHISVRVVDAKGEIFEWRQPLPDRGRSGWRLVSFPMYLLKPFHWDTAPVGDGKIDYPVSFWGYAAQLDTKGAMRAGALIIDDVVLTIGH